MPNHPPRTAHTEKRWRIHRIAADVPLRDISASRTTDAGPDNFPFTLHTAGGVR